MRIRRLHCEELEHAHTERKDIRGHRRRRVIPLVELRGMPTDGGGIREGNDDRFTNDVGEDLGESKIGERDDSLEGNEKGGVSARGRVRDNGCNLTSSEINMLLCSMFDN